MTTLYNVFLYDLAANIPAAGINGRHFAASDTGEIWRDNGVTWEYIGLNLVAGAAGTLFVSDGTKIVDLGVGSDGDALVADSGEPLGVKWDTVAGGSGSPGGSNTQVQFNDSSAFGGDAGLTYDKTTDTLTGVNGVFSTSLKVGSTDVSLVGHTHVAADVAAAGSTTQVMFNDGGAFAGDSGLVFDKTNNALTVGGATVTADNPVLNLTQTWNAGAVTFNGLKLNITNTASAVGSKIFDFQISGSSVFNLAPIGALSGVGPELSLYNPAGTQRLALYNSSSTFLLRSYAGATAREYVQFGGTGGLTLGISNSQELQILTTAAGGIRINDGTGQVSVFTDSANDIWAQRRGTNAQAYRLYNTRTDASNYERAKLAWASNVLQVGTEKAGTGTARAVDIQTDGTTRATWGASGGLAMAAGNTFRAGSSTVAGLPAAGTAGRIAYVTDGAAAQAVGATIAGGGAVPYLVWDNGTNWTVIGV